MKKMTRTEFIEALRAMADDLEQCNYHIINIGDNTIFANKNYGQVWAKIGNGCTINVDLFSATEEEKKEFEEV